MPPKRRSEVQNWGNFRQSLVQKVLIIRGTLLIDACLMLNSPEVRYMSIIFMEEENNNNILLPAHGHGHGHGRAGPP